MAESSESLRAALTGTILEGRDVLRLEVLDTGQHAWAVRIRGDEVLQAWQAGRGLVHRTGRWPVAVTCWSGGEGTWESEVASEDFFSRFYYEESADGADVSPTALIARAERVDLEGFLRELEEAAARYEEPLDAVIEYELDLTREYFGSAPTEDEARAAQLGGTPLTRRVQLDRWLYEWERQYGGEAALSAGDTDPGVRAAVGTEA